MIIRLSTPKLAGWIGDGGLACPSHPARPQPESPARRVFTTGQDSGEGTVRELENLDVNYQAGNEMLV